MLADNREHAMSDLLAASGGAQVSVRAYIAALEKRDYVRVDDRGYVNRGIERVVRLIRNTGPRAPAWSVHSGEFRDWNLDPAMSGDVLGALIGKTGLSLRGWLIANNLPPTNQTRLRQMISGHRPVSENIAALARQLSN